MALSVFGVCLIESEMHKRIRDGVDLELAFKSQMRRLAPTAFRIGDDPARAGSRTPANVASNRRRAKADRPLHSVPSTIVRRVTPLLDGILSRVRRYFTAPIQEEMQALGAGLHREMRTQVAALSTRLDRRVMVDCGPDELLVRSDVGYVLCPRQDYALLVRLLEGECARGTHLVMARLLRPGDVFIDVGANLGLHTLAAARAMRGVGRIVAFEPREPIRRLLERTVELNGLSGVVDIPQAAVSSRTGQQRLSLDATSDHRGLALPPRPADVRPGPTDVDCVTLDAFMASNPAATLIRIDAHGAELDVLEGSRCLIRDNEDLALMVTLEPARWRRADRTTRDWLSRFEALGLAYRVIDDATGVPESCSDARLDQAQSVHLLFARPGAEVWHKAAI